MDVDSPTFARQSQESGFRQGQKVSLTKIGVIIIAAYVLIINGSSWLGRPVLGKIKGTHVSVWYRVLAAKVITLRVTC
jgi:hypothetical protein